MSGVSGADAPGVADANPETLDADFKVLVEWVHDPGGRNIGPIWGDSSRDRAIRALRFLAVSTARGERADALIAASNDKATLKRWREIPVRQDPYVYNLLRHIKKLEKQIKEYKATGQQAAVAAPNPKGTHV